jgi:hypothetical protein
MVIQSMSTHVLSGPAAFKIEGLSVPDIVAPAALARTSRLECTRVVNVVSLPRPPEIIPILDLCLLVVKPGGDT